MTSTLPIQDEKDRGFCLKVAVASSITYLAGILAPLIIDPRIHHVRFGVRHYPSWAYWVLPMFSGLIFVATYGLLVRVRPSRRHWCATLPAWLFAIPTFVILQPEFPHLSVLHSVGLAAILTVIATWIRYRPMESAYLTNPHLVLEAKLERTKEEISFWRTGLIAGLAGYLALLVPWFGAVLQSTKEITPDQGEQFLGIINSGTFILLHSAWYFFGCLAEVAGKNRQAVKLLEQITR